VRALYREYVRDEVLAPVGIRLDEAKLAAEAPPADLASPNGVLLLISLDGEPVAIGGVRDLAGTVAEVKSMYVAPGARGQGIGRLLLGRLEGIAAEHGARLVFASTGGLHAAGVFTPDGRLACAREDVGRHNAVDKVIGWALRSGRLPLAGCVLLVSGRASFELVSKAVLAGFPVLAAVSAPSSLAANLAEQNGLTLVGFLRGGSMNVYTEVQRVVSESAVPGV